MTPAGIDLHLHSSASDGRLDPAALLAHAQACGVRVLALTDHDTIAGMETAARAAGQLGLRLVPGVELSADWRGRGIHVLGLGIDPSAPALSSGLAGLAAERERRAVEITRRLAASGAPATAVLERVRAASRLPTRTHFARALVEEGAARSLAEAFERFLARGRPAAVRSRWPAMTTVVSWIVASGGIAVLAHPLRYTLSAGARRELCREFRSAGGRGLEVVCGGASAAQVEQAASLARLSGLAGSVGSDFHDPAVPWNPPGRLAKLPRAVPAVWTEPGFPFALPELA